MLAPVLQKEIGWNEVEYGYIVTAFTGRTRLDCCLLAGLLTPLHENWSGDFCCRVDVAAMGHGLVRSALGFGIARSALAWQSLGIFLPPSKPPRVFPKNQRALATGLFNPARNIGAVVVPLVVPWIALTWGWQEAFILTGLIGFIWLVFWWWLYESRKSTKGFRKRKLRSSGAILTNRHRRNSVAPASEIPGDMGVRRRQVSDRSNLVFYLYWLPNFSMRDMVSIWRTSVFH